MNELLSELFSSRVRAAVLGYMLPRPQAGVSLTEFSRLLGLPISSLQHECYKLERIGLIKGRREGNSRRYRINPDCPILPELTALVSRALGPRDMLAASLDGVSGLEAAFIGTTIPVDVDALTDTPIPLVLIGEVPLEEIDAAVERVAGQLNLPTSRLEAVFYSPEDWQARLDQQSHYAVWLMSGPRTDLVGDPLVYASSRNA
jgi:DNA-binding transcriptional ArsR family regulator